MGTVTIGIKVYTIYGMLAAADDYWASNGLTPAGIKWNAPASPSLKSQALVQASHLLDRQRWQGTPTNTPQIDVVLQWPRTGVVDSNGIAVSSSSIPDQIIAAAYEIAGALLVDPTLLTSETSGKNLKRVKAGPVEAEFFNGTLGITGRFPTQIAELVNQFMAGAAGGSVSGSFSSGGTDSSMFTPDEDFDINKGL